MTARGFKASRCIPAAALAITCLFVGDGASSSHGVALIAQANARAARPLASRIVVGSTRRAVARDRLMPLDLGYSAGAGAYYGYAPGTYGGIGCYRSAKGELVCPL